MNNSLLVVLCVFMFGCATKQEVIYFQNESVYKGTDISLQEQKIQPNDILKIDIVSLVPEAAIPYNKINNSASMNSVDMMSLNGYLVSHDFTIELPVLGKILVKELSTDSLEKKIKTMLIEGRHLEQPIINVRILNSKITLLGEVNKPGTYYFTDTRMTILQALGMGGDLTINGKRSDLLLIREKDGKRKTTHIDLTNIELLDKPYFEIQTNDVIIVQPNYAKVKSAGYIGSLGSIVSITSLIVSLTVLLTK